MKEDSARRLRAAYKVIDEIGVDEYARLRVLTEPMPHRLVNRLSFELYSESGKKELTNRQRQVMGLLLAGMTKPKIAVALGISPETVKRHIEMLYQNTEVHSVVMLLRLAVEQGWFIDDGS